MIQYAEFNKKPELCIKKIEKLLKIKIPKNYAEIIRETNDYHCLGANRLSFKANRKKFKGIISNDERWHKDQNIFTVIFATLLVHYFNKKWLKMNNKKLQLQ